MRSYLIAPLAFAVSMSSCSLLVRDVEVDDACGNSVVQPGLGEECDDGNIAPDDGCSPDCKIEPFCGDGVQGADEACDDNNSDSGDGCSDRCVVEFCGDGVDNNNTEECDEGDENSNVTPDACREDCSNPSCGDSVQDTGETCDDGNNLNNDGCSSVCAVERCGDDIQQDNEECDDGNLNSDTAPNACRSNCLRASCGDFVQDTGEECDDGNNIGADDCSSECKSEILTELEPNDLFSNAQDYDNLNVGGKLDGSLSNASDVDLFRITVGTTTSLSVTVTEAVAPNGDRCTTNELNPDTVLYLFSDPGPGGGGLQPIILFEDDDNGPGTCSKLVLPRLAPGSYFLRLNNFGFQEPIVSYRLDIDTLSVCGDGQITPPFEDCEGGPCLQNCTNGTNCGDGILDVNEQCDDSNTTPNDGCSPVCQVEPGNFFEVEPNDDARLEEGNDDVGNGDFLLTSAGAPFTTGVTIHGRMLIGGGDEDYYLIRNPTATATVVTIQTADPAQGFSNGLCDATCDTNLRLFKLNGAGFGALVDSNNNSSGIGLCSLIQNAPIGPNETLVLQVTESGDDDALLDYLVRITL